jgi:hypothetical protein
MAPRSSTRAASGMSWVTTRSPGRTRSTIALSATSKPPATCRLRTKREGGVRSHWLATRVTWTCARSAARNRMSLITPGQASASTQICAATVPASTVLTTQGSPSRGAGSLWLEGRGRRVRRPGRTAHVVPNRQDTRRCTRGPGGTGVVLVAGASGEGDAGGSDSAGLAALRASRLRASFSSCFFFLAISRWRFSKE